jgi:hypothetical protein
MANGLGDCRFYSGSLFDKLVKVEPQKKEELQKLYPDKDLDSVFIVMKDDEAKNSENRTLSLYDPTNKIEFKGNAEYFDLAG